MPRISGVDIPDNKQIRIALRYLHGIGANNALDILKKAGVDPTTRSNKVTEDELARIISIIDSEYIVEGALRRQIQQNVQRLREIRSYRGERHRRGLPCRGQRTKTNARTRKGRRKTVATKKGVKAMK
ncbi:MAG: 30S ribosomal protein S13 [Phycisphaeraceae bacterium]